jgi:hypothetical protein
MMVCSNAAAAAAAAFSLQQSARHIALFEARTCHQQYVSWHWAAVPAKKQQCNNVYTQHLQLLCSNNVPWHLSLNSRPATEGLLSNPS